MVPSENLGAVYPICI